MPKGRHLHKNKQTMKKNNWRMGIRVNFLPFAALYIKGSDTTKRSIAISLWA
jgi:hypothetical protein